MGIDAMALHTLARARGVPTGDGSQCALCGTSPYHAAGAAGAVLSGNFADYALMTDPGADHICAGCAELLSGRPGRVPPPLRTHSVLAEGGVCERIDWPDWWPVLTGERTVAYPAVLSWARTGKRHHWMSAGVSTPDRWRIGSDDGCIDVEPAALRELCAAVQELREAGASKAEVLAGQYAAGKCIPLLAPDAEARVAQDRGALVLDLVVWAAPKLTDTTKPEVDVPIPEEDRRAVDLISTIAWGSPHRVEDGVRFWGAGGFLIRRLRRHAHRDLPTLVSRLIAECGTSAESGADAARQVDVMTHEDAAAVLASLRERADLVVALSLDRMQDRRSSRTRKDAP